MITKKIHNCKDCPLKFNSGWGDEKFSCSLDEECRAVYKRDLENFKDSIKFEDDKEWCPLNDNYVVINKTDKAIPIVLNEEELQVVISSIKTHLSIVDRDNYDKESYENLKEEKYYFFWLLNKFENYGKDKD